MAHENGHHYGSPSAAIPLDSDSFHFAPGLVDAPRAFSMKLSMVTKGKCGLMPSKIDPEL